MANETSRPAHEFFPELSLGGYLPPVRPAQPARSAPAAPPAMSALAAVLDRLEQAVDEETEALGRNRPVNLEDFNQRKSRSLLELTRMIRTLPPGAASELKDGIARLAAKLARNQRALKLHLTAAEEIAGLIVQALGEADSDGTYGAWEAAR